MVRGGLGQPQGKRALERPRLKWEYNINTDLKEVVWERVIWQLAGCCECGNELFSIECWEFLE